MSAPSSSDLVFGINPRTRRTTALASWFIGFLCAALALVALPTRLLPTAAAQLRGAPSTPVVRALPAGATLRAGIARAPSPAAAPPPAVLQRLPLVLPPVLDADALLLASASAAPRCLAARLHGARAPPGSVRR